MTYTNINSIIAAAKEAAYAAKIADWEEESDMECDYSVLILHEGYTPSEEVIAARKAADEAWQDLIRECHGNIVMAKEVSGL